jgi:hypothetical protein
MPAERAQPIDPLWNPRSNRKAKPTDNFKSRNALNLKNTAHQHKEAITRLWAAAGGLPGELMKVGAREGERVGVVPPCPLFLKAQAKRKKGEKKKKITKRISRALKSHTLNTMASGAIGAAVATLNAEAGELRCDVRAENPQAPMVYALSKPQSMLLDSFAKAYAQEMFANSVELRKAMVNGKGAPMHGKVTVRSALAGAEALTAKVAAATTFAPAALGVRLPSAAGKPKGAKAARSAKAVAA